MLYTSRFFLFEMQFGS